MKRVLSFILAITLVLGVMIIDSPKANAFPGNYFWFPKEMHVRIYHISTDMWLGIDRNGNEIDGARLQLQRYEEGNQNQIFYLKKVSYDSKGRPQYQIRVHGESDMVIEIRNSSHDDYAEAAQWTTHDRNCAKWTFYTERNLNGWDYAICCIKNVESGKLLNVTGNESYDGNNLIQYHEDNTAAEEFLVYSVENDIIGAMWSRDWKNSQINLAGVEDTPENRTKFFTPINVYKNGYIWYPAYVDKRIGYLATVIWADSNLQKKLLQLHNPPEDGWSEILDAVVNMGKEWMIDEFFGITPLGGVPMGDIEGVLATILTAQSEQQWYIIEKAFEEHSKVRIEIYYTFDSGWWGANCVAIVNDGIDTYWSGSKEDIGNSVNMNYSGNWIEGSVEYFYR